jgi:cutinase
MSRIASLFAALLLALSGILAVGVGTGNAAAPCVGKWDVVVGGFVLTGGQDSFGFIGADQRVGYNSYNTSGGRDELNRLVRQHRAQCPGDWISMTGHSGGAAVVHAWIEANGNIGNINAVLLADPKRAAGPGGPGFAQTDWPFNALPTLAGANANFRGVPTLTICRENDHICNSWDPWNGGYATGAHSAYDFDVNHYSTNGNGVVWLPRA